MRMFEFDFDLSKNYYLMESQPLLRKTFAFAVRIVKLRRHLTKKHAEYDLSRQLMRSGTAPGALCREAKHAESKKDFVHKLAIAQKECEETMYWLELLHATDYLEQIEFSSIHEDAQELMRMLTAAIKTTKKRYLK